MNKKIHRLPWQNLALHFKKQDGQGAVEYLVVTSLAVLMLVIAANGETPLADLAAAVIGFYSDFSYAVSLATP